MNTDLCVWDYASVADWVSETFSRSADTCNGRPTCPHFSCMVCGLVRICKTHNEFWWWQYFKLIDKIKFLYVITSFLYWPRCVATYRYVHTGNIICAYLLHSHSSFLTITNNQWNSKLHNTIVYIVYIQISIVYIKISKSYANTSSNKQNALLTYLLWHAVAHH